MSKRLNQEIIHPLFLIDHKKPLPYFKQTNCTDYDTIKHNKIHLIPIAFGGGGVKIWGKNFTT